MTQTLYAHMNNKKIIARLTGLNQIQKWLHSKGNNFLREETMERL
jgi:hypothetical protein